MNDEEVLRYISIFDTGLVPLKDIPVYRKTIPSKIFHLASMNIPILIGVKGEAEQIINEYNAGIVFEPENEDDFILKCKAIYTQDLSDYTKGLGDMASHFERKKMAKIIYKFISKRLNENFDY